MTRIIGGVAGGRRLRTPPGDNTRPTSDRVREALFSTLESQLGTLAGCRFLDVYAGSGAVGLEASSRGAAAVVLIEHSASVAALVRSNAATLGLEGIHVIHSAADKLAGRVQSRGPFDVAFFDPPYDVSVDALGEVMSALAHADWLAPDAVVVVERARRGEPWRWPLGFEGVREKKYGDTMLWYGHASA
jgi:16S rRNA (guanine966-N2)-methyltransferase